MGFRRIVPLTLFLCAVFAAQPSRATDALDGYFIEASQATGVPASLLLSVAYHESRLTPWALNVGGRSHFPESMTEAKKILSNSNATSYDVGLMQINNFWLSRLSLSVDDIFPPKFNVHLGAQILADCLVRYNSNIRKSLSCYHSGSDSSQEHVRKYVQSIIDIHEQVFDLLRKKGKL